MPTTKYVLLMSVVIFVIDKWCVHNMIEYMVVCQLLCRKEGAGLERRRKWGVREMGW